MTRYLLPLSSKFPAGAGNKARLLGRAAAAGLAVPVGWLVPDEGWQAAVEAGLAVRAGAQLTVPSPSELLDFLGLSTQNLPARLAVRSAFAAEDRPDESLAGFFETVLDVDGRDPAALAGALCCVWGSAGRHPGPFRQDLLLLEMVPARHAGVAFLQPDFADHLVNFTAGTADKLVGGQTAGERLLLPRRERPPEAAGFERRLQRLLRAVERRFGQAGAGWDVEWADDGQTCWLLQVRPITRPPRRNERFTFANIREIMPDPPSPLMTSVVAACAADLYAYYRGFDPTLPRQRPLIEIFAGRPLFNLSLLTETMRHWGLPARLVTNSIGGAAPEVDYGLQPGRFLAKAPVLLRQGWAQLTAVRSAKRATEEILARTERPGDSLAEVGATLRWLFTRLVTEMFNLTAALSAPLLILRLSGTLTEHNARHEAVSTRMYTDLAPLRELAAARPELQERLAAGQAPDDPSFQTAWTSYMATHGHRGIYESDIARPRYHEAPEPLLASLIQPSRPPAPKPARTAAGLLTWPVWWQCRRVLNAREWWRYHAMTCYDRVRQRFLVLAEEAVAHGRLPTRDHLWWLTLDELARLDGGWTPDGAFWQGRQAEIAAHAALDLPDLVRRFDNLEAFQLGRPNQNDRARLQGLSLTGGRVTGRAWVLREPALEPPAELAGEPLILVARSVDAGWIPTFGRVAGAAVEIGGDLSHGSIILREIGLPAITNVPGLTAAIQTGDEVTLLADSGQLIS